MGATEYARDVPPLYIYWQAEAVFCVKYRGKKLLVGANGRLDAKAMFLGSLLLMVLLFFFFFLFLFLCVGC
jgi:hypothetical protein